jgi:hypothetical protein
MPVDGRSRQGFNSAVTMSQAVALAFGAPTM